MNTAARESRWKAAHDLTRCSNRILLRLFGSYARLQTSHQVVAPPCCTSGDFCWCEAHRNPKLSVVQLDGNQREREVSRHYANDFVGFAVEQNLLAENAFIAVEAAMPDAVAENRDRRA